jgi:hypothetical protein
MGTYSTVIIIITIGSDYVLCVLMRSLCQMGYSSMSLLFLRIQREDIVTVTDSSETDAANHER